MVVLMKIIANKYTEAEVMNMIIQATRKSDKEIGELVGKAKSTIEKYKNTKSLVNSRPYTFSTLMKICRKYNFEVIIKEKEK